MRICGYDLETTGLLTPDHRILEVYIGIWDAATETLIEEMDQRIDPQRGIAADAQRVHGISSLDLSGKPVWPMVAPDIAKLLNSADLIVAHNGDGFDAPFTDQELQRVGLPKITAPWFDTMLRGRWASFSGKVPNLGELCMACDVAYDPALAHAASYDVHRMVECFFKGVRWGWFEPPISWKAEVAIAQAA